MAWRAAHSQERPGLLTTRIGNPSLSAVESGLPTITKTLRERDYFPMTNYWEEPTVRYRPGLTSDTALAETVRLAQMSRTADTPVPPHHRVDRHPTTVAVPTQPSKTTTKTTTKTDTKKSGNHFFLDVEGLRGIAVALVVLFHAGVPHLAGGFVGVDVFFVISGFLITGLLLREFERNGRVSFRAFYARRARRIIPPAAVTIVATAIAVWFVMPLLSVFRQAVDLLAAAANVANWRFIARGQGLSGRGVGRQRGRALLVAFHRGTVLLRLARSAGRVGRAGQAHAVVHPHGRGLGNRRGHRCVAVRVAAVYGQRPRAVIHGHTYTRVAIRRRRNRRGCGTAANGPDHEISRASGDVGARLGGTGGGAGVDRDVRPHHALSRLGRVGADTRCRRHHRGRTDGRQRCTLRRMVSVRRLVAVAGQGFLRLVPVALARTGAVQELHGHHQLASAGGRDDGGAAVGMGYHRAAGTPDHVVGRIEAQSAGLTVGWRDGHRCGRRRRRWPSA